MNLILVVDVSQNYPSDDILIYEGKDALEGHFKSRIKEVFIILHAIILLLY